MQLQLITCFLSRAPLFRRPGQQSEPEEINSVPHETNQESLPNYSGNPSPFAPITPPSNHDGFEAPPSYDAAMRGEN